MERTEAYEVIAGALASVAPEVDLGRIDPGEELAFEADLDSMDFLHVVEAVSAAIGRDIPESDYRKVGTLDSFVDYVVGATTG
jgi:acyl carrier protein